MSSAVLEGIAQKAQQLRSNNEGLYGVTGAARGTPGYVKDGWRNAVQVAAENYYRQTGKTPSEANLRRRKEGSVAHRLKNNEDADALYRGYRRRLEALKARYWNAGLHIKAVKPAQPKKNKKGNYVRKRKPPVILPFGKNASSSIKMATPSIPPYRQLR